MKNLSILACLALTSCIGFKELPVEYDYSYKGNFKKYRTYEMMRPVGMNDDSQLNDAIEKSIVSRMKFLGYKKVSSKPHLVVAYKMYPDSLKFRGYTQPPIETWIKSRKELSYDKTKYNMQTGTLLIQFFDRRQNMSIWQGYATSVYGDIDFNNQRQLRNAVISILDKYRFWAEGYVEQQSKAVEEENNP